MKFIIKFLKLLAKMHILYGLASLFLFLIIRLIRLSCSFEKISFLQDNKQDLSNNAVYFIWHNSNVNTFLITNIFKKTKMYAVISPNRTSSLIRFALKMINFSIIDGSRGKKVASSIKQIMRILNSVENNGIIVAADGSYGPAMKISDVAILKIIQKYKAQLRFCCVMSKSVWELKNWDKTIISKPFSKNYFVNELLLTKKELETLTIYEMQQIVESRMNYCFNETRKLCNLRPYISGAIKK